MIKLTYKLLLAVLLVNFAACPVCAADSKDIGSVEVLTDPHLAVAISEIASLFTRENMITVGSSFGATENQEKHIEDGEAADLFITSNAQLIQQLRLKGMVDIHSITRVASQNKDVHYMAAVVAGENMTPARTFLAFLKSDKAREVWKKNGLTVP
jgi:ABC-type molybdate transport system substrate-binding protein